MWLNYLRKTEMLFLNLTWMCKGSVDLFLKSIVNSFESFSLQSTFSFAHLFLVHKTKVFMKSKLKTKSLIKYFSVAYNFFPLWLKAGDDKDNRVCNILVTSKVLLVMCTRSPYQRILLRSGYSMCIHIHGICPDKLAPE